MNKFQLHLVLGVYTKSCKVNFIFLFISPISLQLYFKLISSYQFFNRSLYKNW